MLAAPSSSSRADIVVRPRPAPAVAACQGRSIGQGCTLGRTTGTCVRQIDRSSSSGGLWSRESDRVLCVPDHEITPRMRACIALCEWAECSVGGTIGQCALVGRFLECRPVVQPPPA